jgi:hypothetical protein
MLEHISAMATSAADPDNAGTARQPHLDPHAIWAQAGRSGDRAPATSRAAPESSMAEPQFATHPDDDLPITFRRDRDARRQATAGGHSSGSGFSDAPSSAPGQGPNVTVTAIEMPFGKMVWHCLKWVMAAIPAVFLLGTMLYLAGQALQKWLPWLVKMRIVITFPG